MHPSIGGDRLRQVALQSQVQGGAFGTCSLEAQHFIDLAFNQDRGPVTVYGVRLHLQF
jgi:hypothetical protein